jgi:hypothetical protein
MPAMTVQLTPGQFRDLVTSIDTESQLPYCMNHIQGHYRYDTWAVVIDGSPTEHFIHLMQDGTWHAYTKVKLDVRGGE